jgi:hypothetical protein
MSRTYRTSQLQLDCNCGAPIRDIICQDINRYARRGIAPFRDCYCCHKHDHFSKRNYKRDRKPWNKSPKWFKVTRERSRRAKVNNAMAQGDFDNIPFFRKGNDWEWV